jgi:hypothetical protein
MNVGDRISFPFANRTVEGVIWKIYDKKVLIKVDFPRHKGKIICRKAFELENPKNVTKGRKRKKGE